MAKNDAKNSAASDPLEQRVDAMMDPRAKDQPAVTSDLPPLDIFAGTTPAGAPPLPGKAKKVAAVEAEKPAEEASEPVADQEVSIEPVQLDTPQSDAAIDDIVAQEADAVLAAEDAGLQQAAETVEATPEPTRHGHPVFWFIVFIMAAVAIVAAVFLLNPNLDLPFSA